MTNPSPLGIFDSGIGGLTVYRALRDILPHEDFVYLGDTLRLPYGARTRAEVERFTLAAARLFLEQGCKFLAVACNTISAQALEALQRECPDLPYCGVISTSAEAAVKATRNNRIAILATEGTVRSGVYPDIIRGLRRDADIQMLGCPELVLLAEQSVWQGAQAEQAVAASLSHLTPGYDTLVLGCTHFPLLLPVFRKLCPPDMQIIDGATATAQAVAHLLAARNLSNDQTTTGTDSFLVTGDAAAFARIGSSFLGRDIAAQTARATLALACSDEQQGASL